MVDVGYLTTTNKKNGSSGWSYESVAKIVTKISRFMIIVVSASTLYIMQKMCIDTGNVGHKRSTHARVMSF